MFQFILVQPDVIQSNVQVDIDTHIRNVRRV